MQIRCFSRTLRSESSQADTSWLAFTRNKDERIKLSNLSPKLLCRSADKGFAASFLQVACPY
jgi:hypothetical protein